jgi:hypothetical protein
MNLSNGATECSPPALIDGERHHLVIIGDEMGAQNRTHPCSFAGTLKIDDTVDTIGVGAGQGAKALPSRRFGEHLGAGDPDAERKVRVNVEVGDHLDKP